MLERYKYILNIALESVFINKFRSILTALGIIFGVAAVIAMMAIGKGAQKEILDQMKLVGVNNIIISAKTEKAKNNTNKDENSAQTADQQTKKVNSKYSPGLTVEDGESILQYIPTVNMVSPELIYTTDIVKDGQRSSTKLTGVTPDFFRLFNITLSQGEMFNEEQLRDGKPVCIIGPSIKSKFFAKENAIGRDIKCGYIWLKVIGVIGKKDVNTAAVDNLGISDYNNSIYAPVQTLLSRFKDRSLITSLSLHGSGSSDDEGDVRITDATASDNCKKPT